ncbi:MAG: TonB-dependent receptor domain-containing protein [Blastocatellia bacterium]
MNPRNTTSFRANHSRPVLFLFSFLLCLLPAVRAGQTRPAVSGHVRDGSGAAISGAVVTLRNPRVGLERAVATDADGVYVFPALAPGPYQISVAGDGFSLATRDIELNSESLTVDFVLTPGALTANINVIATEIAGSPQDMRRLPGSADIIDARTLDSTHPFNFNEALRRVPGVHVRDEDGFGLRPSIGIRGLDPNRSAKVLLLEDGVPLGHAPYGDTDAYYHPPIERYNGIEILKGSAQIAHGPNTLSGLINYITPAPPEKFSGSLTLVGGNRRYFNGHASLGAGFGRTGMLLDILRKQGDGSRENIRSGLHDTLLKVVTAFDRERRHTISLKGTYYGENSNVTYSGLTEAEYAGNPRFNPFRNDFFYGARRGGSALYTGAPGGNMVLTVTGYYSHFRRDWWRQSSNSDQRPNRRGKNGCDSLAQLNTLCGNEGRLREYETLGLDPRLHISHRLFGMRAESDLGFRAHRETQNRVQRNNDTLGPPGRDGALAEDNLRENRARSGYFQHRLMPGRFTITPGLRIEHVEIRRVNRLGAPVAGQTALTQLIPGLGVSWNPTDTTTIFAGLHRGFAPPRPADIIGNNGGVLELDPELSWNYEIGMRSLPVRGLRVDATLFRLAYENQIVPANLSGGTGATLTSGGRTLNQGFEFSGRLDTGTLRDSAHNLYVRAAYTWIPVAEYRGRRFSNIGGFSHVSIAGNRLLYAPEHMLNMNLGYTMPLPRGGHLETMVESVRISRQYTDDLNTIAPVANGQRGLIRPYTTWNATINYRPGGQERFAPTLFITTKNLTNDTFIVDRRRGIMPGIPRLVQAGVKFRF